MQSNIAVCRSLFVLLIDLNSGIAHVKHGLTLRWATAESSTARKHTEACFVGHPGVLSGLLSGVVDDLFGFSQARLEVLQLRVCWAICTRVTETAAEGADLDPEAFELLQ